jgi:tetratricopeptide (TPR) repeat protein
LRETGGLKSTRKTDKSIWCGNLHSKSEVNSLIFQYMKRVTGVSPRRSIGHLLRERPVVALLVLFTLTAAAGAGPEDTTERPAPTTGVTDPATAIETLFRAARYDSLLALIDAFEQTAVETGDSILLGRMFVQRGRVQLMRGSFDESARSIDAGINIAKAAGDTSGWMPALTFKGYALAGLGSYDKAMECYQKRLFLARRVGSSLDEAWALTNVAYVQHARGDQETARDNYTRAIFLFRAGGRTDLEVTPLIGLGRVLSALGDTPGAVHCYQRAWVVAHDIGDRVNEMWAANNLGALESARGDMGRAIQYAQHAYEIARDMGYPRGAILPAINIASWRMELGEFERAEAILNDAEVFYRQSGDEEFHAKIDFHKARLALNRGEYRAAVAEFRRLLAEGRLEPQNRDFAWVGLASALALCDSAVTAADILSRRLASQARWYADSGNAARLVLSRLLLWNNDPTAALEQAVRCREEAEDQGWRRTAVSARLRETACYRALGRGEDALASLGAALDSLESVRGGQREPEWREVYGQHTSAGVLDAGLAVLDYPESIPRNQRERILYDTLQRFKTRTLLERINAPRTAGTAPAVVPGPVTLARLQSVVLSPDELLLDFVAGDTESILFAVTSDSLRVLTLPGSLDKLRDKVAIYRGVLSDPSPASQILYSPAQIHSMQAALGRVVLGGVADLLPRFRRVLVSPDGFFALIPFGTLVTPAGQHTPGAAETGGKLLMETHDVVALHSAGTLALLRANARPPRGSPARILVIVPPEGVELPGAMEEAHAVERAYEGVEVARGLGDGPRGLTEFALRFDVLHIAAHARVNDESPWNSGFDFAKSRGAETGRGEPAVRESPPDTPGGGTAGVRILSREDSIVVASTFREDQWLRAWQIARLSLPLEMAVLAGCETAGGRATSGEGVLGLTAAFASAGVPVVVSSLWPIDDRSTARVMEVFYQHLASGLPVADALRRAQLDVRGRDGALHPFYWAGFSVVGDGTAVIQLKPSGRFRFLLFAGIVAGAVAMAAGMLATRRKRGRRIFSTKFFLK